MRNTPGVLVRTSPVAVSVSSVVHAPRVHVRPDGADRLLLHDPAVDGAGRSPADRGAGGEGLPSGSGDAGVDRSVVAGVLAAARALYPGLRTATAADVLIGERPIPADGLPVLGRVVDLPDFHFAVSHSGITVSLHVGDLVAAEVLGEDRGDVLAPFRFERFARAGVR